MAEGSDDYEPPAAVKRILNEMDAVLRETERLIDRTPNLQYPQPPEQARDAGPDMGYTAEPKLVPGMHGYSRDLEEERERDPVKEVPVSPERAPEPRAPIPIRPPQKEVPQKEVPQKDPPPKEAAQKEKKGVSLEKTPESRVFTSNPSLPQQIMARKQEFLARGLIKEVLAAEKALEKDMSLKDRVKIQEKPGAPQVQLPALGPKPYDSPERREEVMRMMDANGVNLQLQAVRALVDLGNAAPPREAVANPPRQGTERTGQNRDPERSRGTERER